MWSIRCGFQQEGLRVGRGARSACAAPGAAGDPEMCSRNHLGRIFQNSRIRLIWIKACCRRCGKSTAALAVVFVIDDGDLHGPRLWLWVYRHRHLPMRAVPGVPALWLRGQFRRAYALRLYPILQVAEILVRDNFDVIQRVCTLLAVGSPVPCSAMGTQARDFL